MRHLLVFWYALSGAAGILLGARDMMAVYYFVAGFILCHALKEVGLFDLKGVKSDE